MKQTILIWMAALMMSGVALAQQPGRNGRMPDPKVRAERMTERMAKAYSLDEAQKKQLLEANLALVEKMGSSPVAYRRGHGHMGRHRHHACCCCQAEGACVRADSCLMRGDARPRLTDEQRAQRRAEREKRREEMKTARTTYDTQLKKIMTDKQYAAYEKNVQERRAKMASNRK